MTHWKLTLAYHGATFHGWQIQPELPTVQGTLADALYRLTGERVLPQGAGRTDAGVHALGQVASFALQAPIPSHNLQRALNRVLPAGIRVLCAEVVPPNFHARHSARGKIYEYRLFERRRTPWQAAPPAGPGERLCSPFLAPFVWDCRWPVALEPMQAAAQRLLGTQDFSAMAATLRPGGPKRPQYPEAEHLADGETQSPAAPNPLKTIYAADWERRDDLLVFRIHGSGFLYHMVRNLVGTMVEIGRGSLQIEDLTRILASRRRAEAGPTAPAQGLFLAEVFYEQLSCELLATPAADERAELEDAVR